MNKEPITVSGLEKLKDELQILERAPFNKHPDWFQNLSGVNAAFHKGALLRKLITLTI